MKFEKETPLAQRQNDVYSDSLCKWLKTIIVSNTYDRSIIFDINLIVALKKKQGYKGAVTLSNMD